MEFTRYDIPKQLESFIRNNNLKVRDTIHNGFLIAVYDKNKCIKRVRAKIKKHENEPRMKKFIPLWEKHLNTLESL